MEQFTVHRDGVPISVSRGGRGRPLVFCPGLGCTQDDLHELLGLLRRDHDVTSFDLSGHGRSGDAARYSFGTFLGDLGAVLDRSGFSEPPVLAGHSLGADLVLRHAAEHPGSASGLVLVDGANPLPEPFVTDADLPLLRALAADPSVQGSRIRAETVLDLQLEIDVVRSEILGAYRRTGLPIHMIMSTTMAGDHAGDRAPRHNRLWRAGVERLVRERPDVGVSWVDADHGLVVTHAPEVARLVREIREIRETLPVC